MVHSLTQNDLCDALIDPKQVQHAFYWLQTQFLLPSFDLINFLLLVLITDLIIYWNHNNLLIISCLETEITNWTKGVVPMETFLSKLIGVLIRAGETTNLCEAENKLIAYCV